MTKQEYYDLLARSAKDGMFPSVSSTGDCAYRGEGGKKCAAGVLIPDEMYDPIWDSYMTPYHSLPDHVRESIRPEGMTDEDVLLVQVAHDDLADGGWDANWFIGSINDLCCFKDVEQVVA